jgi:hypothetical protein
LGCHNGMTHPQVADGEGLQIHWIGSGGQPKRGGPPAWGLGRGLTTPHCKKVMLQNIAKCLEPELRHEIWNLEC